MVRAFFPGKFQPPHIGHIMTISKLVKEGYIVVVGITGDTPRVMSQSKVKQIFESIFFPRDVECFVVKGRLIDYKELPCLPKFDVLMSGNDDVLEWGLRMGLAVKKISRSEGMGCSGTELRELYDDGDK